MASSSQHRESAALALESAQRAAARRRAQPADEVIMTTEAKAVRTRRGTRTTKMINQYEFKDRLGRGQHGEVYVAYDTNSNTEVAIKAVKRRNPKVDRMSLLKKKNIPASPHLPLTDKLGSTEHKIRKEIAIMKKCRHPHVVRLLEVIDDKLNEKIYMVMEYLAGGEIKWRTEYEEPILRVDQTRRICRDVILGLEYLHHQGIIHRDIKPANLLWSADRRMVKIADFGVSHFSYAQLLAAAGHAAAEGKTTLSSADQDPILMDDSDLSKFAGTPMFLAPEIISDSSSTAESSMASSLSLAGSSSASRKKPAITKAIDVWAFGVTLYGLLFGRLPFRAEQEFQIYNVIRNEDWDVPETMGLDNIPVGGRHPERPRKGEETEGYLAIMLLQGLLEKDARRRITLNEVKRHPWILRDMPNSDEWLRQTKVAEGSLAPTDAETQSALSTVHFRWVNRLTKGMSTIFRNVRPQRSFRHTPHLGNTAHAGAVADEDTEQRFTRSAPSVTLGRHKSASAAALTQRDKDKAKHQQQQQQRSYHHRASGTQRSTASSRRTIMDALGAADRAQGQSQKFEPFAMWAGSSSSTSTPALAGSSTKPRRGSAPSGRRPLEMLRVPSRPQPIVTTATAAGAGAAATGGGGGGGREYYQNPGHSLSQSQIPSPISAETSQQPSPEDRPRSRLSLWVRNLWRGGPYGPSSSQEASTSTLASGSPKEQQTTPTDDFAPRRSQDRHSPHHHHHHHHYHHHQQQYHHRQATSRKSSGSGPLTFAMRAASWGEAMNYQRPSEDMRSMYSAERIEDMLDENTLLAGAGGVAQSPVPSFPSTSASAVLSTVSSYVSLGPPAGTAVSAAQTLLQRVDGGAVGAGGGASGGGGGEHASSGSIAADAAAQDPDYRRGSVSYRSHTTSPLAQPSFSQDELNSQHAPSTSTGYDEYDGSSSSNSEDHTTPSEPEFPDVQPSTSQMYQDEDEESDVDNTPLEVRTRRPSVTVTEASSPPRLPRTPRVVS